MKILHRIYTYTFTGIGGLMVILSFFPIFRYYLVPVSILIILIELYRLKKIHQIVLWLLKKQEIDVDIRNSKILSFALYSIIICLFLYVSLWAIIEIFYIYPLKSEISNIINIKRGS